MEIMDMLLGLVIAGVFIGVFVAICYGVIKKDMKKLNEINTTLSEEAKTKIMDAPSIRVSDGNTIWRQQGMIYEAKEKGNRMELYVLWYNRITRNEGEERIEHADVKVNKNDYESHGLKPGDFVMMELDLQKCNATIVFE